MESRRLDRVRVDVAGEIVEISWHERNVLLEGLVFAADMKPIRVKFEGVGPSRWGVELDFEDRSRLRNALDDWGSDRREQQDGIARLHEALVRAKMRSFRAKMRA